MKPQLCFFLFSPFHLFVYIHSANAQGNPKCKKMLRIFGERLNFIFMDNEHFQVNRVISVVSSVQCNFRAIFSGRFRGQNYTSFEMVNMANLINFLGSGTCLKLDQQYCADKLGDTQNNLPAHPQSSQRVLQL